MNVWGLLGIAVPAALVLWYVSSRVVARGRRGEEPSPMPASRAGHLTNPIRQLVQPPGLVLDAAGIEPGMTVLELGPGPGYFTLPAARRVGPTGRVIAADIQPEMIEMLRKAAAKAGVSNLETHVADACSLPVGDSSVDVAFMVTVLGEIPNGKRALAELRRVLKPDGLITVFESALDPHHLQASDVTAWGEASGFELVESRGNWLSYHMKLRAK